jgi:putative phosphoribosyl transferase
MKPEGHYKERSMSKGFIDRAHAGVALGEVLRERVPETEAIVLALPRGGVVTGFEIAQALGLPLDVLIVRKLGVPGVPELAMGAVARGVRVLNEEVIEDAHITPDQIEEVAKAELAEVERREAAYRRGRPAPELANKTVILVDDGIATGSTMLAAIRAVRAHHPQRLVVAVPVAPHDTCERLRAEVDELICLAMPEPFFAISMWYEVFPQISDAEVKDMLERAQPAGHAAT